MTVDVTASIGNASYYGIFAPPGLQLLGEKTGVSFFSNATLPFAAATSRQNDSEPLLPSSTQVYGYNILLLNNESAAILDIPQPSYISAVQEMIAPGDSWNISAPVFATVATFNHSSRTANEGYYEELLKFCECAQQSSAAYNHQSMMNNWSVVLVNHASPGPQTRQYLGRTPDAEKEKRPDCSEFALYARLYGINRRSCEGT